MINKDLNIGIPVSGVTRPGPISISVAKNRDKSIRKIFEELSVSFGQFKIRENRFWYPMKTLNPLTIWIEKVEKLNPFLKGR